MLLNVPFTHYPLNDIHTDAQIQPYMTLAPDALHIPTKLQFCSPTLSKATLISY